MTTALASNVKASGSQCCVFPILAVIHSLSAKVVVDCSAPPRPVLIPQLKWPLQAAVTVAYCTLATFEESYHSCTFAATSSEQTVQWRALSLFKFRYFCSV
jgi:hypothetical protein